MSSGAPEQNEGDDTNKKAGAENDSNDNNSKRKDTTEKGDDNDLPENEGAKKGNGDAAQTDDSTQSNKPSKRPKVPIPPIEVDDAQLPELPLVPNVTELSMTYQIGRKKPQTYTEATLKDTLGELQRALVKTGNVAGDERDLYDLKLDMEDKRARHQDVMDQEELTGSRRGHGPLARLAKAQFVEAEKAMKKAKNKLVRKGQTYVRDKEHRALMDAQARLEDWLYYQDSANRWKRLRHLYPDEREQLEAERLQRRTPYLLDASGEDYYHDWLHGILNMYDERGVGTVQYREGYKDALGNDVRPVTDPRQSNPVGPRELHLWTPTWRRRPVGLGRDPEAPTRQRPWDLNLDNAAIERRRADFEFAMVTSDLPSVLTHDARRRTELASYAGSPATRPTTSNVRVRRTPTGLVTDDQFRRMQSANGVFIAAKESSWDWLTSYDLLGPVKPVTIPEVLPVSDVRHDGDEAEWQTDRPDDDPADDLSAANEGAAKGEGSGTASAGNGKDFEDLKDSEEPEEPTKRPTGDMSTKGLKRSTRIANMGKGDGAAAVRTSSGKAGKNAKAHIDYPYRLSEFTRDSEKLRLGENPVQPSEWAEETTGRREWHAYGQIDPCSPVDSPPNLPVNPEDMFEVPDGFTITHTKPEFLEPGTRRKCKHDRERCRAWWDHRPEDCWIAYPEEPTRPHELQPILDIDPPRGAEGGDVDGYVPSDTIPIYRSRLCDHYGLLHNKKRRDEPKAAAEKQPQWPRFGIRVPYEPMTFDDRRLKRKCGDKEAERSDDAVPDKPEIEGPGAKKRPRTIAKDWKQRTAYEMRSMAVPIIEKPETVWPWAPENHDPVDPNSDDGGESDDEGDNFRDSYEKCSFPGGRPPPTPPVRPSDPDNPESATQAAPETAG